MLQAGGAIPRLVLKHAGPSALGEPQVPLSIGKLEAFLRHAYGIGAIQARHPYGLGECTVG